MLFQQKISSINFGHLNLYIANKQIFKFDGITIFGHRKLLVFILSIKRLFKASFKFLL